MVHTSALDPLLGRTWEDFDKLEEWIKYYSLFMSIISLCKVTMSIFKRKLWKGGKNI